MTADVCLPFWLWLVFLVSATVCTVGTLKLMTQVRTQYFDLTMAETMSEFHQARVEILQRGIRDYLANGDDDVLEAALREVGGS